jgi:hypothetical protein
MVTVSLESPSREVTLFDPAYRWFIGTLPDRPRDYTVWSMLEPSGMDSCTWAGIIQVGSATGCSTFRHKREISTSIHRTFWNHRSLWPSGIQTSSSFSVGRHSWCLSYIPTQEMHQSAYWDHWTISHWDRAWSILCRTAHSNSRYQGESH